MTTLNNCNIPDNLLYWPEKHVWVQPEDDGSITIGVTDVAQHLAGPVLTATPKPAGKSVKRGRSAGTVESSKWVGPVTAPITGEIIAINDAIISDPGILNSDPYGAGWFIKIQPADWDNEKGELVTGEAGMQAYQEFLDAEGIVCGG